MVLPGIGAASCSWMTWTCLTSGAELKMNRDTWRNWLSKCAKNFSWEVLCKSDSPWGWWLRHTGRNHASHAGDHLILFVMICHVFLLRPKDLHVKRSRNIFVGTIFDSSWCRYCPMDKSTIVSAWTKRRTSWIFSSQLAWTQRRPPNSQERVNSLVKLDITWLKLRVS